MVIGAVMKGINKYRRVIWLVVLIILSIAGMSMPFIFYLWGWFGLIGLLPFMFLLNQIKKMTRNAQVFIIWLVGFISMSIILHWLLQTQPERWTAFTETWATVLLVVGWIIMASSLSVGYLLFGFVWTRLKLDLSDKYVWLSLPALWVLCEFLRTYVFSIVSMGPATTIGPYWGFGTLGFATSVTPLVFAGRIVGIYGLSILAVLISLSVYKLIITKKVAYILPFVGIIIVVVLGYLIYLPTQTKKFKVSSLQLGVDATMQTPGVSYYDSVHYNQDPADSDILVAPEYSQIFEFKGEGEDPRVLLSKTLKDNGIAITSTSKEGEGKHYNELIVYNKQAEVIQSQHKQFLIPVGESSPYLITIPLRLLGKGPELDMTMRAREVGKGDKPIQLTNANGYKVGALVCSGAIAPFMYQELVRDGAKLLTNSASLSIFDKSYSYHQQTQQIARFIATASNRPFIQSTDGSYSYIIDKNGNYLVKSSQDKLEMISANVQSGLHRTIYDYLGEWLLPVSGVVLLTIGYHKWNNKRKD
jgi:apolipoprotein N-acyltransferase